MLKFPWKVSSYVYTYTTPSWCSSASVGSIFCPIFIHALSIPGHKSVASIPPERHARTSSEKGCASTPEMYLSFDRFRGNLVLSTETNSYGGRVREKDVGNWCLRNYANRRFP